MIDFIQIPMIIIKHGAYKYSGEAKLRFDILEQIQNLLPDTPLVLHGASGVDSRDVQRLLELGVNIQGAKGIPEEFLRRASKMHICKINGDTDVRMSYMIGILSNIENNNKSIDYRGYLGAGMQEVAKLVSHKIEVYNSAKKAN